MKNLIIFVAPIILLAACQTAAPPVTSGKEELPAKAENSTVSSGQAWEVDWNKTINLAKKEGRILVYCTANVGDAFKPFKEKYGIEVELIIGRGAEISTRLASERRAGLYLADVYQGGATTLITAIKPAGTLEPVDKILVLPEVVDETKWLNGRFPFIDKEKMIISFIAATDPDYVVNTNLVKPEELKNYLDILNPKWKGKIVMNDPTTAGSGLKWFGLVMRASLGLEKGKEYMRNLAKQEPVITRDQRLQMDWVGVGKYAIAIAPQRELIDEFLKLGVPIRPLELFEITDISPGSGNVALINRTPHPNAAKVFINWLLTKEGQTSYVQVFGSPSARLDVSTRGLDPTTIPDPKEKYFMPDESFYSGQTEMRDLAMEIFGALLR